MLGGRKWGALAQGVNLMPFIYRLHYSLTLETVGQYFMGIVALAWTQDCFVGICLIFPAPARHTRSKRWLSRWWPAWKVRWPGRSYKPSFYLHRAGGLWPWAIHLARGTAATAIYLRPASRTR